MKVAVPTRNGQVEDHFGHCEAYGIFTVGSNNKVEHFEVFPSTQGCGCKSNIISLLKENEVSVMLAGNMGNGALTKLNNHGIDVYRGCSGDILQVVEFYLEGNIDDSGESCTQHEHHGKEHNCAH
ncbi:NifB/NifX family molybdenum-iron cluster-binding protein [Flammeovirgaceae bacterium SG7u.111]|nr:NifB/NifX family molybdenum-iron cluster-binding protein [Flammeovirgaceae bacterium SG7u.132]WPO36983.1 NifB/NifX family molybdenum-iron cluster-binding protein [Flammeovirgaceae bacterium SG7u.111]